MFVINWLKRLWNVQLSFFHWPLIVSSLMVRASGYRAGANDGRIAPTANPAQDAQALAVGYGKWSYVMLPSSCALPHTALGAARRRATALKSRAENSSVARHT